MNFFGDRDGVDSTAGVGHGLAAAGLVFGEFDFAAKPLQHIAGGEADIRVDLIDITGDEQTNTGHARIPVVRTICTNIVDHTRPRCIHRV